VFVNAIIKMMASFAGAMLATAALAQAPATAPAGSTGLCKDGSYWTGATKQGACRGHKGVKEWYGAAAAPAAAAATPAATTAAPASPAPATAPAASKATPAKSNFTPPQTAAPGGGPGQVWVNHKSKVYHCNGDRWYGKTKDGEYMSESDATAKGYRPDHGKPCK
jgi:hypothetical protein